MFYFWLPALLVLDNFRQQRGGVSASTEGKWEKMCWNCVFNPLTVLIDDKVAKALDHPEMAGVIRQIVGEVMAVSAAVRARTRSGDDGVAGPRSEVWMVS